MNQNKNILVQILVGYLLADIITGTFHWFEDTYLDYCNNIPILKDIAKDNELHHYFPRSIISYSYFENISSTLPPVLILLVILYITNKDFMFDNIYFVLTISIFIIFANIIHRFSHLRDCEKSNLLKMLQKYGILCSSEQHKKHHELSNEKYCPITGYSNYILDKIYFWRSLENIVYILTGVKPSRKGKYADYERIQNHMHENSKLKCPKVPTKEDTDELVKILENDITCNIK